MKLWLKISQICIINIYGSKPPRWPPIFHTACYSHHCAISFSCMSHGPCDLLLRTEYGKGDEMSLQRLGYRRL